jgi:hypothetical protein
VSPRILVFSNLDRIGFLEIFQCLPRSAAVYPLDAELPTLRGLVRVLPSIDSDALGVCSNCTSVLLMVDDLIHYHEVMSFRIYLTVHVFRDDVGGIFINMFIWEFNLVDPCVKDQVGVASSNRVAVSVSLPPRDFTSDKRAVSWQDDSCGYILVEHFSIHTLGLWYWSKWWRVIVFVSFILRCLGIVFRFEVCISNAIPKLLLDVDIKGS